MPSNMMSVLRVSRKRTANRFYLLVLQLLMAFPLSADSPALKAMIAQAIDHNPDIQAMEYSLKSADYRVPQQASLPDPMVMVGYQNDGFERFSYGESAGSQLMFSYAQTFPAGSVLAHKKRAAECERDSMAASLAVLKAKTAASVTELYWDLFFNDRLLDILHNRAALVDCLEKAALAKYSAGLGMQQDVLMAQIEKYEIAEKEALVLQEIASRKAMLQAELGRVALDAFSISSTSEATVFNASLNELLDHAQTAAPLIQEKQALLDAQDAAVMLARNSYFPDYTLNAGYFPRGTLMPMWSLSLTMPLPMSAAQKQDNAVKESTAAFARAQRDLLAAILRVKASINENYAMIKASEKLMVLYKDGLILKNTQNFDGLLASYSTGKIELVTLVSTLKNGLNYEQQYWEQWVQREKGIAKIKELSDEIIEQ